MMESAENICQIYKYDKEFFLLANNSPEYFAKEFVSTEISPDKVVWLNYQKILSKTHLHCPFNLGGLVLFCSIKK